MFTGTTHSKRFLPKGFKYTVYYFSTRLKFKVMGKSYGEYCATLPGVHKAGSAAHLGHSAQV